ncbi:MAG: mannose-6-phosphate isomerase [Peptococcaceae bacterium]|jgi:copper(I)-binding protein|nr:mannose-6-phosphate isomerase [Peptococcaceae bacterium]
MIPRGVEHLPIAKEEVHVMLIDPKSTLNTGNIVNEKTIEKLDWI